MKEVGGGAKIMIKVKKWRNVLWDYSGAFLWTFIISK